MALIQLAVCFSCAIRQSRSLWINHRSWRWWRSAFQRSSRLYHQLCSVVCIASSWVVGARSFSSAVYTVVAMFSGPVINLLGPKNAAALGSLSYVSLIVVSQYESSIEPGLTYAAALRWGPLDLLRHGTYCSAYPFRGGLRLRSWYVMADSSLHLLRLCHRA